MNKSKRKLVSIFFIVLAIAFISFRNSTKPDYISRYNDRLSTLLSEEQFLLASITNADLSRSEDINKVKAAVYNTRQAMKAADFWLRYLEPTAYKKINGPLPVEWETEVFEKFEKPYKRDGAGLALAALYLEEPAIRKDSLLALITSSIAATHIYTTDSITKELYAYHHFFLCNRLFLLNLAAIYTTGFETPGAEHVIPELKILLSSVREIYQSFNNSFAATTLSEDYLSLFSNLETFVSQQAANYEQFDHYTFIRDYVNPLFTLNQSLITQYGVVSHSLTDYTLSKKAASIFDKDLYNGQSAKGIFLRVTDSAVLAEIGHTGKLLFYDPLLSGNNMRSCASCHKSAQYFTDTSITTALHYNQNERLARNTPSLVNCVYNHLAMLDGKHISLQNQAKDVISNPAEMACDQAEMVKKVLSCKEYKQVFNYLLKYTPQEKEITADHIVSSITWYYSKFSGCYAPFDDAMTHTQAADSNVKAGFNLFMGKAQCGTCHFVPQFNGVKPPYIGSEFEVLGTPADTLYKNISPDPGRYTINPATETYRAFRTGTIRNAARTAPYMHNGVFRTLDQVLEFYNTGGGSGHGFNVNNQTLSADSLHLTAGDKKQLIAFINSLSERIEVDALPDHLPKSNIKSLNNRKPGGEY